MKCILLLVLPGDLDDGLKAPVDAGKDDALDAAPSDLDSAPVMNDRGSSPIVSHHFSITPEFID